MWYLKLSDNLNKLNNKNLNSFYYMPWQTDDVIRNTMGKYCISNRIQNLQEATILQMESFKR